MSVCSLMAQQQCAGLYQPNVSSLCSSGGKGGGGGGKKYVC